MTDKVERNGKVAVLISRGFGAGWYTWSDKDEYGLRPLFDPELVEAVLAGDLAKMYEITKHKFPNLYGDIEDLDVVWVDKGSRFIISEYDGNESILIESRMPWITA